MSNPFKPISIALLPNFVLEDVLLGFKLILQPWRYLDKAPQEKLKRKLLDFTGRKHVVLFESGRAAEYFLLKALNIGESDEVIIQAFTCVAVPNSILWNRAKVVYCDIDDTLNLDPAKLEKLITKKTKVVIVQHTFGTPADTNQIKKICSKNKVLLVEDLAHGFGNPLLGNNGTAAFLSFGRDKTISGIWGGAVVTDDKTLGDRLEDLSNDLPQYKRAWVFEQLLFILVVYFILQAYSFLGIGKLAHKLFRQINLLPKVLDSSEKEGHKQEIFYRGMPGALSELTIYQLSKLKKFVEHRKQLAKTYGDFNDNSSYLRYSIFVDDPSGLRSFAAKKNIFLGDWYDNVIAPKGVNLEAVGYKMGSCVKAEEIVKKIVNLPTNPNLNLLDAKKVNHLVEEWKLKK